MTESDKLSRYGPIVARCNSRSEPDRIYEVRCKAGVYSCNCKGWIFNRDSPKRCRHTDRAARECRQPEQEQKPVPVVRPRIIPSALRGFIASCKALLRSVDTDNVPVELRGIVGEFRELIARAERISVPSVPVANAEPARTIRLITFDD